MSYRTLVSSAGIGFFPLGFCARLPYAMAPLATLILIDDATASFTFARLAGAAPSVAMAVSGPVIGELADRFGHRAVGVTTALANIAALLGLLVLADARLIMAVLAGLSQPQVGPLVRVFWSRQVGAGLLPTALAYEAAADETSFVVGPALVGLLTPLGSGVAVVVTVALLGAATVPFALRQNGPLVARQQGSGRLQFGPLGEMFVAMAAIGAIFGIVQTGVTAYAPNSAGLIYAEFGVGSAVAGAAYAWLPRRFTLRARYPVFAAALVIGMGGVDGVAGAGRGCRGQRDGRAVPDLPVQRDRTTRRTRPGRHDHDDPVRGRAARYGRGSRDRWSARGSARQRWRVRGPLRWWRARHWCWPSRWCCGAGG